VDEAIHQLLLSNDSETDLEFPSGFDWTAASEAVRHFRAPAEFVLGQSLRLDDQVQDASFFAELFVFAEGAVRPDGVTFLCFEIAIRFSSFGRMATIHTNSSLSDLGCSPVDQLAALLGEHGFVHVPVAALAQPYDGKNLGLGANFTWWDRFFDYV
jgi:hypothetical protein